MKKILFLVTQSEMGGAQRYVFEAANGLAKNYEVLVVAGEGDGELFKKISYLKTQNPKLNIQNKSLKALKRAPNPLNIIQTAVEILRVLREEKPDVLFLCSTTAGLLGSIAGFLYNKSKIKNQKSKIIYRIGGWAFRDPRIFWKNWLILLLEKMTAPLKDKIIVNSEIDRQLAIKYKIAPLNKIIKIYNGINADSLNFFSREQARGRLKTSFNRQMFVGTVANFYETKGLNYLIKAFVGLDLKLLIIGDGRLRPHLESQIKKLKLQDRVMLLGRIPDAYKYLKAFDIFVLPSLKEGFPWIILEAMAAEVPIVATKVGALPEIIEDAKDGLLVEPANSRALAEKIQWLTEHPTEGRGMASRAKTKMIQQFSLSKMIEATQHEL